VLMPVQAGAHGSSCGVGAMAAADLTPKWKVGHLAGKFNRELGKVQSGAPWKFKRAGAWSSHSIAGRSRGLQRRSSRGCAGGVVQPATRVGEAGAGMTERGSSLAARRGSGAGGMGSWPAARRGAVASEMVTLADRAQRGGGHRRAGTWPAARGWPGTVDA
jgi:hypothetical protein